MDNMKASERLRELAADVTDESPAYDLLIVHDALPLIADVVEAAEEVERSEAMTSVDTIYVGTPGSLRMRISRALTALRDALQGEGSPPPPEGATAQTKAPAVPIAELFNPYADDEGAALEGDTP